MWEPTAAEVHSDMKTVYSCGWLRSSQTLQVHGDLGFPSCAALIMLVLMLTPDARRLPAHSSWRRCRGKVDPAPQLDLAICFFRPWLTLI
jgi:hypothetical protein